jgi:large subunit ribosomal protein L35
MARKTKKYKIKTYKGAAKRFRVTGSGRLVRTKGNKSHLRRNKAARTKAQFSKMIEVTAHGDKKRVQRLAPYLSRYKANPPA